MSSFIIGKLYYYTGPIPKYGLAWQYAEIFRHQVPFLVTKIYSGNFEESIALDCLVGKDTYPHIVFLKKEIHYITEL